MAIKRHKPEEIITKLRQVEVLRGQGLSMADAIRQIGVTEVTFYRWRKDDWGLLVRPSVLSAPQQFMSALPPIADIISHCIKCPLIANSGHWSVIGSLVSA